MVVYIGWWSSTLKRIVIHCRSLEFLALSVKQLIAMVPPLLVAVPMLHTGRSSLIHSSLPARIAAFVATTPFLHNATLALDVSIEFRKIDVVGIFLNQGPVGLHRAEGGRAVR